MAQVMKTHVRQTSLSKSLSKRRSTMSGLKNPPYPSQNTSPLSCHFSPTFTRICSCCIRCTRNASKATPGSTIRLRLDLVFGSPSTYPYPPTLVIVRCTETKPCLKSISSHRNASSSPRLIPVVNAKINNASRREPRAASSNFSACSTVSVCASYRSIRGGDTSFATFRATSPCLTASSSARCNAAWISPTVLGLDPSSSTTKRARLDHKHQIIEHGGLRGRKPDDILRHQRNGSLVHNVIDQNGRNI